MELAQQVGAVTHLDLRLAHRIEAAHGALGDFVRLGLHLRREAEPEVLKSGATAAVSLAGLEQCLWDLQGKAAGVPCYQLFGGLLSHRIRNYANINRSTEERSPEGFGSRAGSSATDKQMKMAAARTAMTTLRDITAASVLNKPAAFKSLS